MSVSSLTGFDFTLQFRGPAKAGNRLRLEH